MAWFFVTLPFSSHLDTNSNDPIQSNQGKSINCPCSRARFYHRNRKTKIDCLRFVMCPLLVPIFKGIFVAVAINSTNKANVAGVHTIKQSILLRCLWVLHTNLANALHDFYCHCFLFRNRCLWSFQVVE